MDSDNRTTNNDPNNIGKCINCNNKLQDRHFMYDYNNNFCCGQCKDAYLRKSGSESESNIKTIMLLPKLHYYDV